MMKAWQPVPTLTKTIVLFFIMAIIFLSIGIAMIIVSKNLSESSFRYDTLQSTKCPIGSTCNVTFEVSQLLQSPVFVYYEIHNFYQNHRLYASSYSYSQLTGTQISASTVIFLLIVGLIIMSANCIQQRPLQKCFSLQLFCAA